MVWSGLTSCFLSCPDQTGKELINFLASRQNTNPILEDFALMTQSPPKGPTSYYTGTSFQNMNLKGHKPATPKSAIIPNSLMSYRVLENCCCPRTSQAEFLLIPKHHFLCPVLCANIHPGLEGPWLSLPCHHILRQSAIRWSWRLSLSPCPILLPSKTVERVVTKQLGIN